ncbi:MAG: hypothetical protein DHS20C17_18680 [Cyclobacteriaceae bacterium]|nr:MAG: hypothetical protein DHS20C17_18680 [Cyclobacteriaceae bacterium]
METEETLLHSNTFGTVSNKRIIVNTKSGAEEIPVRQVSSINFKRQRNYFFAIGGLGLGTVLLAAVIIYAREFGGPELLITLVISLIAILSGIANWIGHHVITISTSGIDRKPIKVEMSKTQEGVEFVKAVRNTVFKK